MSALGNVREIYRDVVNAFANMVNVSGARSFNDFNVEANKNVLNINILASDSLAPSSMERLAMGLVARTRGLITAILHNRRFDSVQDAVNFWNNNIVSINTQARVDTMRDQVSLFHESAADGAPISVGHRFENVRQLGHAVIRSNDPQNPLGDSIFEFSALSHFELGFTSSNTAYGENDIERGRSLTLSVIIKINILQVPQTRLIEALIEANGRGIFEDYLQMRAGNKTIREFLLNIAQLKREAKRDTSSDLVDRVFAELLSKRGVTKPIMLNEMTTLKNFVVVLDIADVDRFQRERNQSLVSGAVLNRIFKNFNIMSLLIMDHGTRKVTLFDSDRPSRAQTLPLRAFEDREQGVEVFNRLLGGR